jgi:hypothetical protein
MAGYCSAGQSPQRAVLLMEEEIPFSFTILALLHRFYYLPLVLLSQENNFVLHKLF